MSTSPPDGDYAVPYAGVHEQLSGHGLPMGQPIYYNTLSQGYYGNQGQFRGRGGGRYKGQEYAKPKNFNKEEDQSPSLLLRVTLLTCLDLGTLHQM